MKKIIFITKLLLCAATATVAQSVGINNTGTQANASAILDVSSTSKGLLIPRMTAAQRSAIANPATGLQVYQTDSTKGFYYFNGTVWAPLVAAAANFAGWSTTGNAAVNPSTNFIGTTDAQPFIAKVNGEQVFSFSPGSTSTIIGTQASNATSAGGAENHIIGYQAGFSNTGFSNHFEGFKAGYSNTSGYSNQFIGYRAGYNTTTGTDNLFIGAQAGYSNTTGSYSHFIGNGAGYSNTTGTDNHFNGFDAGESNTTGSNNHFDGNHAGFSNTTSSANHFSGDYAGYSNTYGYNNFFSGYYAGYSNSSGSNNTFSGNSAGKNNVTGWGNVFYGNSAGYANNNGLNNVFIGSLAGNLNYSGDNNVAIGAGAGANNTIGSNNVFIGTGAGSNETGSDLLYIANSATSTPLLFGYFDISFFRVNGVQEIKGNSTGVPLLNLTSLGYDDARLRFGNTGNNNKWDIYHSNGTNELVFSNNSAGDRMALTNAGNLFVTGVMYDNSDKRLKKNIAPLKTSLQKILKLNGYTYNWIDSTRSKTEQIGLISQEVKEQFPQLVATGKNGFESVAYSHLVPVLIESIKEQQAMIETMQLQNNEQQKENEQLKKTSLL